jgi:hypothetical protein
MEENNMQKRSLISSVARSFRKAGYDASCTSGAADVIITRKAGDATDLTRPITKTEIDEVLAGWLPVHDPKLILDPFLFGKKKLLRNGGTQTIHFTPATVILMQMKTTKGTAKKRKGGKT